MSGGAMSKREKAKFDKLLAQMAKMQNKEVDEFIEEKGLNSVLTIEDHVYEGQAVYNFYQSRIQPVIEKKEFPTDFDKRFREWRIKTCKECLEEFAYAYHYDGVSFCSLDCLEQALLKLGIKMHRNRPLNLRWGTYHPAIVPASAFATLKASFADVAPNAFDH